MPAALSRLINYPSEAIDALTELQLRVARRADELAASQGWRTQLNLACWLQAEQEIFGPGEEASGNRPKTAAA